MGYQRGLLKEKLFDRAEEKYGFVNLFVFLGIESDECYYEMKKCGDIDIGPLNAFINTKMGGDKLCLATLPPIVGNKRVVVIGADVAHPWPSDKLCASVAAVVGNIDANCMKHYATVKVQHRYSANEIIFYRDGVSEGQFMYVMDFEISKIKLAFQSLGVGFLYDENKFGADQLHELTYYLYYLCHTYARCTRSVSIPSCIYYAHLAAHRARGHINGSSGHSDSGSSGGSPNMRWSKRVVPNTSLSHSFNYY
ncbi:unnamed protein product [Oppiella nova]|uniref:Piwi domain-containing protein n=1 Tax=Oppiella nova TaxID=334625 RepID=A0A7R9QYS4_9ACAR|nr:unnamed protein product [Oppiella nova]CAG2179401.1 unnamed protein product [Oppiella nova]